MARSFLGGIVAGFILFALGWLFWQTPLSGLAYTNLPDAQGAAVQTALAQNLTQTGTGTYRIPDPKSQQGALLFAKGPIATVDYNIDGFSPTGTAGLLPGLIVALGAGMLIAFGLGAVAAGRAFGGLARLVVFGSLGVCAWIFLATPIANHFGWGFWIYAFVAEAVSFIAAGLVVARWFVPRGHAAGAAPVAPDHVQEP
ncbi:MAG: hypothetical protein JO013_08420 [Alphaproteobacteria bacterium]|nr:hypothetical protein [Alphaproteobacteria bacterium]